MQDVSSELVGNLLGWWWVFLPLSAVLFSLLMHTYRRFKSVRSPKRWIAFEIAMFLVGSVGLLLLALGPGDGIGNGYAYGASMSLPVIGLAFILGLRLLVEIFVPVARRLAHLVRSFSEPEQ